MYIYMQTSKKIQYTDVFPFLYTIPKMFQKLNQYSKVVFVLLTLLITKPRFMYYCWTIAEMRLYCVLV